MPNEVKGSLLAVLVRGMGNGIRHRCEGRTLERAPNAKTQGALIGVLITAVLGEPQGG